MSESVPLVKIDIPPLFQQLCPHIFRTQVPGFVATVVDSGNSWVELATVTQLANVKFGMTIEASVRLYPGYQVHFDAQGNFLTTPNLARSKKRKKLPAVSSRVPRSALGLETRIDRPGRPLGF